MLNDWYRSALSALLPAENLVTSKQLTKARTYTTPWSVFQTQILSEPIHLWYNTQIGWALDLIDLTVCKLWPELMVSAAIACKKDRYENPKYR